MVVVVAMMTRMRALRQSRLLVSDVMLARRRAKLFSSQPTVDDNVARLRNIGIIAHIDAGKTTTTERMLFYSGFSQGMGEVHDGDTITDFMPQERERGITITSATISFPWRGYTVNLIDTPGHVDFTIEVERSLRVLDGAVTILDASAGVEAQTLTVWRQADKYDVPRLIFLNKMDKPRADFHACLADIEDKLRIRPLVCQLPVMNPNGGQFCGVFDLVRMQELIWDPADSSKGATFRTVPADQSKMLDVALSRRSQLVEDLASVDDSFAERFVLADNEPTNQDVANAIRKATVTNAAVPLLCGSAFKNTGVQLLLDAVVSYLPDPSRRVPQELTRFYGEQDCVALAFKIMHTKFKGALTFVRVYRGRLRPGQNIYIVNREVSEKCGELLQANADEYVPLREAGPGSIVAISGLSGTVTGDTIVGSAGAMSAARNKAARVGKSAQLFGIHPIEPVFQCRIEAPSLGQQKKLEHALACLQREDPSLVVSQQDATGETLISGMGELHIEIVRDRILREYKVEPFLGPLQIAYRERLCQHLPGLVHTLDKSVAGSKHYVEVGIDIRKAAAAASDTEVATGSKDLMTVSPASDADSGLTRLRPQHFKALLSGVKLTLGHGPVLGFPLIGARVVLTHFVTTPATSLPMVTAAISQCIQNALRRRPEAIELLEPHMRVEVTLPDELVGKTISDLARRRAVMDGVRSRHGHAVVSCTCPLSELKQYSTELRTLTSGRATFTMEFACYKAMNPADTSELVRKVAGY